MEAISTDIVQNILSFLQKLMQKESTCVLAFLIDAWDARFYSLINVMFVVVDDVAAYAIFTNSNLV